MMMIYVIHCFVNHGQALYKILITRKKNYLYGFSVDGWFMDIMLCYIPVVTRAGRENNQIHFWLCAVSVLESSNHPDNHCLSEAFCLSQSAGFESERVA